MAEWLTEAGHVCAPGAPICLFIDWRQSGGYPTVGIEISPHYAKVATKRVEESVSEEG